MMFRVISWSRPIRLPWQPTTHCFSDSCRQYSQAIVEFSLSAVACACLDPVEPVWQPLSCAFLDSLRLFVAASCALLEACVFPEARRFRFLFIREVCVFPSLFVLVFDFVFTHFCVTPLVPFYFSARGLVDAVCAVKTVTKKMYLKANCLRVCACVCVSCFPHASRPCV